MPRIRHYFRNARRAVWYTIATVIITLAVMVSVLRIFLPDVTGYRQNIEELASTFLEHSVRIDSMDARLVGFTPTIVFKNVRMLDKFNERELVQFDEGRLGIALFSSLTQGRVVPSDFTIEGIELAITRRKDGRFLVQGLELAQLETPFDESQHRPTGELADWLFKRTQLSIQKSKVIWQDLKREGKAVRFDDVSLVLRNRNARHQLNGKLSLPEERGRKFEVALDVTGNVLDPLNMQGTIYMGGTGIHLDKWGVKPQYLDVILHKGIADFQLWGEWRDGDLKSLSGDVTAYNVDLALPVMDKPFKIKLLGGLFHVNRSADGWKLNVDQFHYMNGADVWPETRFSIEQKYNNETQAASLEVSTDYFRLEDIAALVLETNVLDKQQRNFLKTTSMSGDIRKLHFKQLQKTESSSEHELRATFEHVTTKPWESAPGMNGIKGEIWTDNTRGQLILDSKFSTLTFPRLFRWPLSMHALKGKINWAKRRGGWQVWADEVIASNNDIHTSTQAQLDFPESGKSPYMDLQVNFEKGNAEFLERYYPKGVMGKEVMQWLDEGIVSGDIKRGGVVFNGRLRDFPFKKNQGQFVAELEAENVTIDYMKDWPRMTEVDMLANFTGLSMGISINKAKLFDSTITNAAASIEQFAEPQLKLSGDVSGSLKDVAYFVVDSPIQPDAREMVKNITFKGAATTRFNANIPLSKKVRKTTSLGFSGEVSFNNAEIYLINDKFDITDLSGKLLFNEKEQKARGIKAKVLGSDATFEIFTRQMVKHKIINVVGHGSVAVKRMFERFDLPGAKYVAGNTQWQSLLTLGGNNNKQRNPPVLRVSSNLQGATLNFPHPVSKPASEARAFALQAQFDEKDSTRLTLEYNKQFSWLMQLDPSGEYLQLKRSTLQFSPQPAVLPQKQQMRVTGQLNNFSLGAWLTALRSEKKSKRPSFISIPVKLDLDLLELNKFDDSDQKDKPAKDIRPVDYPVVDGVIRRFVYDKLDLGLAKFDVVRGRRGLLLKKVTLAGPQLKLTGSGRWLYRRKRHLSELDYFIESDNLERLLTTLGISAVITEGQLKSRGNLKWRRPPHEFDVDLVKGNMHLRINDGSIRDVKPGAGRLLGLLSLSALPRRLMLDFRDTFKEGFSFDYIEGDINLDDGNAYTENLHIASPVADVDIEGRTGIVAQDFDQQVTVVPQVGDTLPVAGGLLFGAQVGAVILFFEKLFGSEIEKASAREYTITGSWDKPVIERVDADEETVETAEPEL